MAKACVLIIHRAVVSIEHPHHTREAEIWPDERSAARRMAEIVRDPHLTVGLIEARDMRPPHHTGTP